MVSTPPAWQSFNTQQVRDLAWALASPPLLAPIRSRTSSGKAVHWATQAWSERALDVSLDWLRALDRYPAPLLTALSGRDARLGRYFENLLAFWLAWPANPLYRLVGQGLAIRSNNLTIGELDFLVEDRRSGKLQHWEVAVKFYLGVHPDGDYRHWVGPALKDRLDLKVSHLLHHQLALPSTSEGAALLRQLGLHEPEPVCLLKGRLFYPCEADRAVWAPHAASAEHLCGWWMSQADFLHRYQSGALRWITLPKAHWLTTIDSRVLISDPLDASALVESLAEYTDNRAIAVIGLDPDHNEVTRGFITPTGWPKDIA